MYLSTAPDGTLYIVDMYRGVVQQRADITEYLRDHIVKHKLEEGIELGRIYRVVHETTKRDAPPALSKATPAQLVQTLSHPNGWRRDTAQRLLVERGGTAAVPALKRLAETAPEPRTRLHALWTLDGIDGIDAALVTKALGDESRDVRASAVRLAERFLNTPAHPLQAGILARIDDPDWWVREQLAASLGALPAGQRETALASLLSKHAADPIVMDAALSGVRGSETALLERLLQGSGGAAQASTPEREAAITMVASLIVRGAQDGSVQNLFAWIGDESAPGLAAIGDVARRGGRVERVRRADAGQSRPPRWWRRDACSGRPASDAGGRAAVPDLSGRPRRPGRRLRVRPGAAGARCRPRPRRWRGPSRQPGAGDAFGNRLRHRRIRAASDGAAGARRVAGEARRCGTNRAADAGRTATLHGWPGGLQEHLHRLPSA